MEKIKVNMSPNPLDVQTIHASQNDGEARQWEFELHNNGELIDTSDVKEQMVFMAYKGGTEQLLPENTSTPTTSPFLGDIRYPQGLLTDQEFTYRQSPTEEDGLAKIADIKGNTIKWNQLVQNGNFVDTTGWFATGNSGTITASNNILSLAVSDAIQSAGINRGDFIEVVQGHKYFISIENKCSEPTDYVMARLYASGNDNRTDFFHADSTWSKVNTIITAIASGNVKLYIYPKFNATSPISVGTVYDIKNVMVIDLTAMGFDSLTAEQFTSLFPLPFYDFNQGSLLSFMGNGIKTVGFNQWDEEWESGIYNINTGIKQNFNNAVRCKNFIPVMPNTVYYFKAPTQSSRVLFYDANHDFISITTAFADRDFTTPSNCAYITFFSITPTYNNNICINLSSDKNGTYEPYTSHTANLPVSTYFPTGMKSKDTVYDELTETKAITRIGSRAYQSGDESDTSVITDGTTTFYPLATPTETSFYTASLVTENGEVALANENGVLVGKCNSDVSADAGFIEGKIKLSDEDGDVYSNKIQLHIERSPQ